MLKIKDNVELKELEKFGFENGIYTRVKNGNILYMVIITSTHRYLQIRHCYADSISGSLQTLLYDLIQAGLVEKIGEWFKVKKLYRVYWSDGTTKDYACNMFEEVANKLWEHNDRTIQKIELIADASIKMEVSN